MTTLRMEHIISNQEILESFLRHPAYQSPLIENANYNSESKSITIFNVSFESFVSIKFYNSNLISFQNCSFDKGVGVLEEAQVSSEYRNLHFKICTFGKVEFSGSNHLLRVKIEDPLKLPSLSVNGSINSVEVYNDSKEKVIIETFQTDSKQRNDAPAVFAFRDLEISNVISKSYNSFKLSLARTKSRNVQISKTGNCTISITNNSIIDTFRVTDFGGTITLGNSTINNVFIDGSDGTVVLEELWIGGVVADIVEIRNDVQAKEISFLDGNIIDLIALGQVRVEEFIIQESTINHLLIPIETATFNLLKISGVSHIPLHINYLNFLNGILAKGYSNEKSTIIMEDFTITSIGFFSFNNYANIFVSKISYKPTTGNFPGIGLLKEYRDELNYNKILIPSSLIEDSTFQVVNSDLGKINFIDCNFSEMQMDIRASKLTELFLAGTEMPSVLIGIYRDRQIGYAQLKKVYENRGDSVKSLDYLALELNAHYEELKSIPSKNRTGEHRRNLFILRMNKWSNNFGTSYLNWPIAVLVMTIIFIAHNFALGYTLAITLNKNEWHNFFEILSLFFEFLYPIHKADFIPEAVNMPVTAGSRILDFTGRIFSGYFIYQFIQVFRKYGKR